MPSDAGFTTRAQPHQLPEWMDEPCSYEEFRACLADLARVNVVTFAHGPTLQWLSELDARSPAQQPLHIVDVGCGAGDLLRTIERWAKRRSLPVKLTGIDLNPHATRAAQEFTPPGSAIEWVTGDAFSYPPAGIDVVLSSLFTHHLEDAEIVRFLTWMEATAAHGWFINDLRRSPRAAQVFTLLARAMRWHRFVQHDGPVSIRRAFRTPDWQRLCAAAGLALSAVSIAPRFPGRLCVGRMK